MPLLQASVAEVEAQFSLWQKLSKHLEISGWKSAYQLCDIDIYPAIRLLLSVFGTLSVFLATAARLFSALRLLKSNLRTTKTESRRHGLSLIYIHSDIAIDTNNIVTEFAGKRRKIDV